ncbi:MAG: hypothetical protein M3R58_04930 [Pseudomonadota bacterium]|nr:hypothetical protein [Pseudomonadota bacterium]
MKLYHRTTRKIAALILRGGFLNLANRFSSDFGLDGVWFSNRPPNDVDRECDCVMSVDLNLSAKALSAFEWKDTTAYREWLIPTEVVSEVITAVKIC